MPLLGSREETCPNCQLAVVSKQDKICPRCGEVLVHDGDFTNLFKALAHGLRTVFLFTLGGFALSNLFSFVFLIVLYFGNLKPMVDTPIVLVVLYCILQVIVWTLYGTLTGFSLGFSRGINNAMREAKAISLVMDQVFARADKDLQKKAFMDSDPALEDGKEYVKFQEVYTVTLSKLRDVIDDEYGDEEVGSIPAVLKKFFMSMALNYIFKTLIVFLLKRERVKDSESRYLVPIENIDKLAEIGTGATIHRILVKPVNIAWLIGTLVFLLVSVGPVALGLFF